MGKHIPNFNKLNLIPIKYANWPCNIPKCSIPRASKIYQNEHFWYANIPIGNPGLDTFFRKQTKTPKDQFFH
jgi:hypothetical protein